jgi:hypothetical protein
MCRSSACDGGDHDPRRGHLPLRRGGRTLLFDREALLERAAGGDCHCGVRALILRGTASREIFESPDPMIPRPIQLEVPVRKPLLFLWPRSLVLAVALSQSMRPINSPCPPWAGRAHLHPALAGWLADFARQLQRQVGGALLLSQGHDPGCTIEAHNFQRDQAKFEAKNAVILGVSVDTPDSHKQFCTKEGLTFRLLADPEHKVVDAVRLAGPLWPHDHRQPQHLPHRSQGKIVKEWTKVDPPQVAALRLKKCWRRLPGASALAFRSACSRHSSQP